MYHPSSAASQSGLRHVRLLVIERTTTQLGQRGMPEIQLGGRYGGTYVRTAP